VRDASKKIEITKIYSIYVGTYDSTYLSFKKMNINIYIPYHDDVNDGPSILI